MKKTFLSLIVILLFTSLLHCENKSQLKKERIYRVGISPGFVTSLNLGIGENYPINNEFRERFLMLHFGTIPNSNYAGGIIVTGLYVKTNYYKNNSPEGFFFNTTLGMDYVKHPITNFNPGGPNNPEDEDEDDYKQLFFPNARIGSGYAFKFENNSGLEFNFELGITAVIMSLNIAYVF